MAANVAGRHQGFKAILDQQGLPQRIRLELGVFIYVGSFQITKCELIVLRVFGDAKNQLQIHPPLKSLTPSLGCVTAARVHRDDGHPPQMCSEALLGFPSAESWMTAPHMCWHRIWPTASSPTSSSSAPRPRRRRWTRRSAQSLRKRSTSGVSGTRVINASLSLSCPLVRPFEQVFLLVYYHFQA